MVMAYLIFASTAAAQQKYAVLITGDYASQGIPLESQWNQGQDKSNNGYPEFWYDTYLMWEMLVYEKGFQDENVFVLFANGIDYSVDNDDWMWSRYNAQISHNEYFPITDYPATIPNVENVFNGLATGTNGFPQVTEDDFLFVWTFGHGDYDQITEKVYIYLLNTTKMWDYEFAALTNQILANKKVFWMQQCRSGGFHDDLESINTVFHSACQPSELAYPVDNKDVNGNSVVEKEIVNDITYKHGEFNFHNYSAAVGESPAFGNNYNGQPYTEADENYDNFISVLEIYNWEDSHESSSHLFGEDPFYSDPGEIGSFTSLEYPTLLHSDISNNINYRGLIGISKDVHVVSGTELIINSNADVFLLNEATFFVDAGATLIIQDNVQFNGNASNSIQINGNIQVGQNVTFASSGTSGSFGGLFLNNNALQTTFAGATFNSSGFHNYGASLTMNNCTFDNCNWVYSHRGNVTINNSSLTETWLYLENKDNDLNLTATVSGCTITNSTMHVGIDLWNYGKFSIENNNIMASHNGIQICNSGSGSSGNQNITGNYIHDCGESGILAYNITGSIKGNNIRNNGYGIKLMNNCNVALYGDYLAQTYSQTQQIRDNSSYEVYASKFSFPWYFRYNAIIDEDNLGNPTDPLVFYDNPSIPYYYKIDVQYNCWGNTFDPSHNRPQEGWEVNGPELSA